MRRKRKRLQGRKRSNKSVKRRKKSQEREVKNLWELRKRKKELGINENDE